MPKNPLFKNGLTDGVFHLAKDTIPDYVKKSIFIFFVSLKSESNFNLILLYFRLKFEIILITYCIILLNLRKIF